MLWRPADATSSIQECSVGQLDANDPIFWVGWSEKILPRDNSGEHEDKIFPGLSTIPAVVSAGRRGWYSQLINKQT